MPDLWLVLLLAALPGVGNFLGGVIAELRRPTPRLLNVALHAASGIIIGVVAVELVPRALAGLAAWWIALALVAGGLTYVALESIIKRLETARRGKERGRMWMIYAAVAVDLTSDGLMIGAGSAVSPALALVVAGGQVLADVPEGYAAVANFRDKGVPRARRILLSSSFIGYVVVAALASYLVLRGANEAIKLWALVFVAGLLTVAAVEDMLEEAHAAREDSRWSVAAFTVGFALFVLVSGGLADVAERWLDRAPTSDDGAARGLHVARSSR